MQSPFFHCRGGCLWRSSARFHSGQIILFARYFGYYDESLEDKPHRFNECDRMVGFKTKIAEVTISEAALPCPKLSSTLTCAHTRLNTPTHSCHTEMVEMLCISCHTEMVEILCCSRTVGQKSTRKKV